MIDQVRWNPKQLSGLQLLSDSTKKFYLFYGASRSGKTYLTIRAIRIRCHKYPGSKHLVARYSFANAKKTIWLQTMLPEFKKDEKLGLCKINLAEGIIHYLNGSTVRLGGLEPSAIDSVLSSEYGTIFINEANENKYSSIETLVSRLNDNSKDAYGNNIKLKFICDLNPTTKRHWSYRLFLQGQDPESGKVKPDYNLYTYLHFSAEDNAANLSEGYIDTLKNLSQAKRKRFYEGDFGSYEGLVLKNFDEQTHVVDAFRIPADWRRIRAIDFGYTHPFVCLWMAYDQANDRVFVYREYSVSQQTVKTHSAEIRRLTGDETISCTVADHDAEDRATLAENGISTKRANKAVMTGIDLLLDCFETSGNKKQRLYIFRDCTELINCIGSYRWKSETGADAKDREVIKEDDDEVDALRYGIMELLGRKFTFEGVRA